MSSDDPRVAFERVFTNARDLHSQGRDEEAKSAYIAALAIDPTHLAALTNLGTLLYNNGYRRAASIAYRQAVAAHPHDVTARVNLANVLLAEGDADGARVHYEAALQSDPLCALAHQGLARVFQENDAARAEAHRRLGFARDPTLVVPYRGGGAATPVLVLMSALGGNVDTSRFFDDRTYAVTKLFAEYSDAATPLPAHRFIFNAIGDADLCGDALARAAALTQRSGARTINRVAAVSATGRVENAARLDAIAGVVTPRTRAYPCRLLSGENAQRRLTDDGFTFPLLVRAVGFHTGTYFERVDDGEALRAAVAAFPSDRAIAISFVDTRGVDGAFRKYRAIFVDGALYPLHLAIASNWKVHYLTADMAINAAYRAEESAFLNDLPGTLGAAATQALHAIGRSLDLDYAGVDFALDARGNVVVFEANATMLVPPPNPQPPWAYRTAAIEAIFGAVRAMLRR